MHTTFWREIAEYPYLDLNTAQAVREKIIVSMPEVKKNILKSKYELMFKFVKGSNILSYYYKQDDKKKGINGLYIFI